MTDRDMIMMLIALCAAVFFITSAGASTAPFLNLIADDLATTLPAVAHLFSVQALTWGIASLVTLLGALGRWRVAIATHGAFVLLCAIAVRLATPSDPQRQPHAAHAKIPYAAIFKPKAKYAARSSD